MTTKPLVATPAEIKSLVAYYADRHTPAMLEAITDRRNGSILFTVRGDDVTSMMTQYGYDVCKSCHHFRNVEKMTAGVCESC